MKQKLFLSLLASLLFVPFCVAQTPKPAATPIVTVTKNDGSIVRGKLTAAGPGSITVEGAGVAATAPVQIAWRDIKTVSNGLTQAKALSQFKTEHADQLCETCHGSTTLLCATCKGTAHDPASGKDCKTCGGELLVTCKAPKCKEGKIPCTDKCLKLSEGNWTTRDGLRVRTYKFKNGDAWISENHLGHIMVFEDGAIHDKGVCPTCGGTTTLTCPTCGGTSKVPCATCLARKEAPPCPAKCDKGHETCKACNGTGLKGAPGTTPAAPAGQKKPEPLPF
jgi:hypothetical protein